MVRQQKIVKLERGVIGVISDTHGLVRPAALAALRGVELIIHAGDIGKAAVLEQLAAIAPVCAIRGNNDIGLWAEPFPDVLELDIGAIKVHVIHDVQELRSAPFAAGTKLIISGHSHKPALRESNGVYYLNPGSAGPRRFKLPIALAKVFLDKGTIDAAIVQLAQSRETLRPR